MSGWEVFCVNVFLSLRSLTNRLAAVFAIFVSGVQWLGTSIVDHNSSIATSSEHFGSAGRSISSGWIACHIVSQWTWAATLLQSSNVAFKFGVSGPFW